MVPEILQHQIYDSPMVDIWSLEVIFVQDGDGGCAICWGQFWEIGEVGTERTVPGTIIYVNGRSKT